MTFILKLEKLTKNKILFGIKASILEINEFNLMQNTYIGEHDQESFDYRQKTCISTSIRSWSQTDKASTFFT